MRILKNVITGLGVFLALLTASTLAQAPTASEAKKARRSYYLTRTEHPGDSALTACVAGFHMASLWEIFDTTNLRYDTTLGFTTADSGSGPPTASGGWIRTGSTANADLSLPPGFPNCNAWTSGTTGDAGSAVILSPNWQPLSGGLFPTSPWSPVHNLCSVPIRVWCVEDEE